MGHFQKPILLSLLLGIGLYFGAMFISDFQATRAAISQVGITGWLIILGLSLVNYGLRYWRWEWYLRLLTNIKLPRYLHLSYYLCGFALSTTPGKAGETVRSLYLKRHGVGYANTISNFFVERFQDLLSIVLLASLAAVLFDGYGIVVVLTAMLVITALPVLHSRWLPAMLDKLSLKLPQKLAAATVHLKQLIQSSAALLKNRQLLGGMVIGFVAWFAEAVGFWYLLTLLNQDVTFVAAVGIYGVAVLVGAVSFLPGGLGSTEAVMGLLLISLGVDKSIAVAATLICRIATLWFAVFIGVGVAGFLATKGITPVFQKTSAEQDG